MLSPVVPTERPQIKLENTMYDKTQTKIIDRREMLKVKLKSLAAEARIIRKEESKTHGALRDELHRHRVGIVREVARSTHIAYGIIRGKTLDQIEPNRQTEPNWEAINKMIMKYGPLNTEERAKLVVKAA
ncbi:hypothetical protein DLP05_071 [Stenotrophomonas phage vB_SmaS_DLP_5]|uniref:Uncharacterized protein n=1 Tax=Stenotrophomonas phage vB_SmaS_DLP_5 TaxID=2044561 RepID=A0A2D2W2J0_9CAUD|nr:hypothetical protein FDJ07_gp070 [Stenotrophomonas phage vB_SmaS_DLP_5]ATS92357.1 hypothetical protein DLP05_071 [Stenotrophomonas phage vB_SmaS_DLP_5]